MSSSLTSRTPQRSRAARLRRHPLVWMLVGVIAIIAVDAVSTGIGSSLGPVGVVTGSLVGGAAAIVLYRLVMSRFAGRPVPELGLAPKSVIRTALLGAGIGSGFVVVSVGIVVAFGGYAVTWHPVDPLRTVTLLIGVNVGAAIVEELVFRGLALQAIEQLGGGGARGTVLAVTITAAFFGGAHLLNPGATLWSAVAIAVEAGVLTGAAFLWKRDLWLVIGLHAAWNIVEGLLGIAVSGHRESGLFLTTAHGSALLTGGTFGLEASLVPVLVGIALAVPMLLAASRRR